MGFPSIWCLTYIYKISTNQKLAVYPVYRCQWPKAYMHTLWVSDVYSFSLENFLYSWKKQRGYILCPKNGSIQRCSQLGEVWAMHRLGSLHMCWGRWQTCSIIILYALIVTFFSMYTMEPLYNLYARWLPNSPIHFKQKYVWKPMIARYFASGVYLGHAQCPYCIHFKVNFA